MDDKASSDFSIIIKDNEQAVAAALAEGHFVQAYIHAHVLMEALLRLFLRIAGDEDVSFANLITEVPILS